MAQPIHEGAGAHGGDWSKLFDGKTLDHDRRRNAVLDNFSGKPQVRAALKSRKWNQFRLECKGGSIKTWLNGVPAAEIQGATAGRGIIALALDKAGMDKARTWQSYHYSTGSYTTSGSMPEIRWRKIPIKEL